MVWSTLLEPPQIFCFPDLTHDLGWGMLFFDYFVLCPANDKLTIEVLVVCASLCGRIVNVEMVYVFLIVNHIEVDHIFLGTC